jgi:ubiquinone/menaquinone biosynthesis C-methylase UbiE
MDGPVPVWPRCHRLRAGVLALLAVAAAAIAGPPSHDATSHRRFDDPAYWSKVFDDPARAEWQKPAEVAAALGLRPGQTVADLGAGTGYFTRSLVDAVGPSGTVLAVDVEPNLVAYLRERAAREHLSNVRVVLADAKDPRLPAAGVDAVLVVDTYHHIDDRIAYFRRLQSALRPHGRVAVVDWHKRPMPVGPEMDHKLAREQVMEEMDAAGYRLVDEPTFLPYQYFLVFQPR